MKKPTTKGQVMDMCICGWTGTENSFPAHFEDTREDDWIHVEVSPLMLVALEK